MRLSVLICVMAGRLGIVSFTMTLLRQELSSSRLIQLATPNLVDHCTVCGNVSSSSTNPNANDNASAVQNSIIWPGPTLSQVSGSWQMMTFTNCDVPGGIGIATDGGGNIQSDPLFAQPPAGNFRLTAGSPCLAAGQGGSNMGVNMDLLPQEWFGTLNQDLVAYYPFNGNANDESANGYNGIIHRASLTTDRFGNTSAFYFDGASSISVPGFNAEPQNFSISLWFQATSNGDAGNRKFVHLCDVNNRLNFAWTLGWFTDPGNPPNTVLFQLNQTPTGALNVPAGNVLQNGRWYHVVSLLGWKQSNSVYRRSARCDRCCRAIYHLLSKCGRPLHWV